MLYGDFHNSRLKINYTMKTHQADASHQAHIKLYPEYSKMNIRDKS